MKPRRNLKAATSGSADALRAAWCTSRGVSPEGEAARQIAKVCADWHRERWGAIYDAASAEAARLPGKQTYEASIREQGISGLNASTAHLVASFFSISLTTFGVLKSPKWRKRAWQELEVDELFETLDSIYFAAETGEL